MGVGLDSVDDRVYLHPACPECTYGKIYLTGDRDALICSMCRTIFGAVECSTQVEIPD